MSRSRNLAAALFALALLAGRPAPASACTWGEPQLDETAASACVIAVGEVAEAGDRTFTLRVEEYWKGAERAPELSVNNRTIELADSDCGTRQGSGHKASQGMRLVAFLRPDRLYGLADWQFAGMFGDGYVVVDGRLPYPGSTLTRLGFPATAATADVRRAVLAAVGDSEAGPPDPAAAPGHPLRAIRLILGATALATAACFALTAALVRRRRR